MASGNRRVWHYEGCSYGKSERVSYWITTCQPPLIPAKKIRLFACGIRNTRRHISRKKKKRRRKKHIYLQSKLRTFSLSPCARANIILQYSIRTLPSFLHLCFRAEKEEEKGERKEKIHFQAGKAQKSLKNATFAQQNKPHNARIAIVVVCKKCKLCFFMFMCTCGNSPSGCQKWAWDEGTWEKGVCVSDGQFLPSYMMDAGIVFLEIPPSDAFQVNIL